MCVSLEVSVASYIIGVILFLAIYKTNEFNNKWIAVFMIYILHMQLLEAVMWLDQECKGYNQIASLASYFFTICQPLVNYLVMLYFVGWNTTTKYISLLMIPYFVTSMYYITQTYPESSELCTKPEKECWLEWKWLKMNSYWFVWLISVFIPFLALPDTSFHGLFPVAYIFTSFMASFTMSSDLKYISKPSLWCALQVLMPILMLIKK